MKKILYFLMLVLPMVGCDSNDYTRPDINYVEILEIKNNDSKGNDLHIYENEGLIVFRNGDNAFSADITLMNDVSTDTEYSIQIDAKDTRLSEKTVKVLEEVNGKLMEVYKTVSLKDTYFYSINIQGLKEDSEVVATIQTNVVKKDDQWKEYEEVELDSYQIAGPMSVGTELYSNHVLPDVDCFNVFEISDLNESRIKIYQDNDFIVFINDGVEKCLPITKKVDTSDDTKYEIAIEAQETNKSTKTIKVSKEVDGEEKEVYEDIIMDEIYTYSVQIDASISEETLFSQAVATIRKSVIKENKEWEEYEEIDLDESQVQGLFFSYTFCH